MSNQEFKRALMLAPPAVQIGWLEEPNLVFGSDIECDDPKTGIALAGPRSLGMSNHRGEVHVGFIGTSQSMEDGAGWLQACAEGIDGDATEVEDCGDRKAIAPFPGCDADSGYRFVLRCDPTEAGKLTSSELREVRLGSTKRERFEHFLKLLDLKMGLLHDQDRPLDCVFVVLPDDLYKEFRVVEYRENRSLYHRDLRRAFKALAMAHNIPTQVLRHSTITRPQRLDLDHPATVAWNLFTGLYFKAGGAPWSPVGLKVGTCAVGVSFYRPLGDSTNLRASVAQAFDESGDVFVLRGVPFAWDDTRQGKQPHLSQELALSLMTEVLARYKKERGQLPRRVVVHKRSRFAPDEREGFLAAATGMQIDLVALRPADEFRLLREGRYPVMRGTHYSVGDNSYLYTTGYLAALRRFPHGHVPTPLEVADHNGGDTSRRDLLKEILLLTKMNWNSANYAESLPITLRFASLVGDILREIPPHIKPQRRYAFYM